MYRLWLFSERVLNSFMTRRPVNQKQIEQEQFSDDEWLENLYDNSKSENTVACAKTSIKVFEHFCISQNSTKEEMIRRYQSLINQTKPDVRSICISLGKLVSFMGKDHDDIMISTNATFKGKSSKVFHGVSKTAIEAPKDKAPVLTKATKKQAKDFKKQEKQKVIESAKTWEETQNALTEAGQLRVAPPAHRGKDIVDLHNIFKSRAEDLADAGKIKKSNRLNEIADRVKELNPELDFTKNTVGTAVIEETPSASIIIFCKCERIQTRCRCSCWQGFDTKRQ